MTYRDLPYYEGIGPKHAVNINFTKISTKITLTVYITRINEALRIIVKQVVYDEVNKDSET